MTRQQSSQRCVSGKTANSRTRNADRCAKFRANVKDDSQLYAAHLAKEAVRSREKRAKPKTPEQKARERLLPCHALRISLVL